MLVAIRGRARGQGGVAVDGCVPNVDVEMSRQRHWPLPNPAPRFSSGVLAVWLRPAGLGGPLPSTKTPPWWKEPARIAKVGRTFAEPGPLRTRNSPFATKHRSPARPHDASRSPLGSGGTGGSISQDFGAGIDWGIIPVDSTVMLALVTSIHVLTTALDRRSKDVDGRDKPDHDGKGAGNSSLQERGSAARFPRQHARRRRPCQLSLCRNRSWGRRGAAA